MDKGLQTLGAGQTTPAANLTIFTCPAIFHKHKPEL